MITVQPISSVMRYVRTAGGDMPDFRVAWCVIHDPDGSIWISGMAGEGFTIRTAREILEWCRGNGVHTIKATRAEGHRLPRGHVVGDHVEIYPAEWP